MTSIQVSTHENGPAWASTGAEQTPEGHSSLREHASSVPPPDSVGAPVSPVEVASPVLLEVSHPVSELVPRQLPAGKSSSMYSRLPDEHVQAAKNAVEPRALLHRRQDIKR
jgi:hypothetical protein